MKKFSRLEDFIYFETKIIAVLFMNYEKQFVIIISHKRTILVIFWTSIIFETGQILLLDHVTFGAPDWPEGTYPNVDI